MARLQKFNGTQALPGVGSPQVIADTVVGKATVRLGPQIAQSAANIGELAETALKYKAKKDREAELKARGAQRDWSKGTASQKLAAQADDLINRRNTFAGKQSAVGLQQEVRQKLDAPETGAFQTPSPLSDEMVAFMKASEAKILNELPDAQKPSFETAAGLGEDLLRTEIATAENRRDKDYFVNGISQTKDLAVETVSRSPDSIDQAFDTFVDLVDTAALPRRLKDRSIQDAGRHMLEAWVQAHPPETQIAELSRLQARNPDAAVSNSNNANAPNSGGEERPEFAARAVALSEVSRNRLLNAALKQQTETALIEQARIAERIDSVPEQVDPAEISGNALLENKARLQLLSRFRETVDTRSRTVSALERIAEAGKNDPNLTHGQGLVKDAMSYLWDGTTDPSVLMRGIAVSTATLPRTAGKALVANLASENRDEVVQAFATMSLAKPDAIKDGLDGPEGRKIRTLLAGKTYLTAEQGLSREAAGALFAEASQAKTRKERLENFAALYPGKQTGQSAAFPLLG